MTHPLSIVFENFARNECYGSSQLYYDLSTKIAEDFQVLEIAENCREGQPQPNLLFAAVQYLMNLRSEKELGEIYENAAKGRRDPESAFVLFKAFVLRNQSAIVELLQTRLVQTNEVRRSAYLYPAIMQGLQRFESRPVVLIEIGTSAGLNLIPDQYAYSYGSEHVYGKRSSVVKVESSFKKEIPNVVGGIFPNVARRIGLDLNIVDTNKQEEADWLTSLVWPEHLERRELLKQALELRKQFELELIEGDGFELIDQILADLPPDHLPCIYHTHVANQISKERQQAFLQTIEDLGTKRELIHIFNNIRPGLNLSTFKEGLPNECILAKTDGHARWIDWKQY